MTNNFLFENLGRGNEHSTLQIGIFRRIVMDYANGWEAQKTTHVSKL
jgi:hypothetical protein